MFERFTDRARKVMALANAEAQRFNHPYIGTEHILAGLLEEGSGVGAGVLKNLGVNLHKVRREVEKRLKLGPEPVTVGRLPQTPRSKKVIEYAVLEARNLKHNYVGTEHILLGLVRQEDSTAGKVLVALGLKLDKVRKTTLELLGQDMGPDGIALTVIKDEAMKELLDRDHTLSAAVIAALPRLPIDEPVTPGRLVLALIESDSALSKRLAPVMEDIRRACAEA